MVVCEEPASIVRVKVDSVFGVMFTVVGANDSETVPVSVPTTNILAC